MGFRSLTKIALAGTLGLGLLGFVLWRTGFLEARLRAFVIRNYVEQIAPRLPFTVESVDLDASWSDLRQGKLSNLRLALRAGAWRWTMAGPISMQRTEGEVGFFYDADTQLLAPITANATVHLTAQTDPLFTRLGEITLRVNSPRIEWPQYGVQATEPILLVHWDQQVAFFRIEAQTAEWKSPSSSDTVKLQHSALQVQTQLDLRELKLLTPVAAELRSAGGESLWGEQYLDLPLLGWPIKVHASPEADGRTFRNGSVTFGEALSIDASPRSIAWNLKTLSIPALIATAERISQNTGPLGQLLSAIHAVEVKRGTLRSQGRLKLPRAWDYQGALADLDAEASLDLAGADLRVKKGAFAARGLSTHLAIDSRKPSSGFLAAREIYFRHARGELPRFDFTFEPAAESSRTAWIVASRAPIPLRLEGLPLSLGSIGGRITRWSVEETEQAIATGTETPDFLVTSLKVPPIALEKLATSLCLGGSARWRAAHLPPATIELDLPRLELMPGSLEPQGRIRAQAFGGNLEVRDMSFSGLSSEVPELNFTAELGGIRLDLLGTWLGFGQMDGTLGAWAREVTFNSWLPTAYDFRIEVRPLHYRMVEFSPEAMKNFVKLFAGDGIDSLPGVAQWLAFGWPSHVFGGYDVQYAGIALHSADGNILVETLDPPKVLARAGKRFILYGPRFKMPLRTERYPVVMDATAMGNFTRQVFLQLEKMAAAKAAETPVAKENEDDEEECLPPDFK